MAKGKQGAVKDTRPTLEEIKVKSGKYVVASYRGYEVGSVGIPAPDPFEMGLPFGYQPKDLLIRAWEWLVIPSYWLDEGRFAVVYQNNPGIFVDKVDTVPSTANQKILPDDLDKRLNLGRKQKAWWIATQPYSTTGRPGSPAMAIHALINMKLMDTTDDSQEQVEFQRDELVPLLQAARFYEERLGNRKDLIRDIDNRLDDIAEKKAFKSTSRRNRRKAT